MARAREHLQGIDGHGRRAGRRRPADPRPAGRRAPRRCRRPLPRLPRRAAPRQGAAALPAGRGRNGRSVVAGDELAPARRRAGRAPAARRAGLLRERRLGADVDADRDRRRAARPLAPALAEAGCPRRPRDAGQDQHGDREDGDAGVLRRACSGTARSTGRSRSRGARCGERPDSWMPALFLRLKGGGSGTSRASGRAKATSTSGRRSSARYGAAASRPSSAPGWARTSTGLARREPRARRDHGFPLAEHQRSELQQVSQFLQFNQDVTTAARLFKEELRDRSCGHEPAPGGGEDAPNLAHALAVGRSTANRSTPTIPYGSLAPARREALRHRQPRQPARGGAQGRRQGTRDVLLQLARAGAGRCPSRRQPKGRRPGARNPAASSTSSASSRRADSLVLTEDDYFDYLISLIQYKPRIPGVVGRPDDKHVAALPRLPAHRLELPGAVPADHEPGRELEAQAAHPRRGAGRSRGGRAHQPAAARKYLEDYFGSSGARRRSTSSGAAPPSS